jgi:hypothetical protein
MERHGKIVEITNKYGADESDVVVYIDTGNSSCGLHISKCHGFIPKVGDEVRITHDDTIEKL